MIYCVCVGDAYEPEEHLFQSSSFRAAQRFAHRDGECQSEGYVIAVFSPNRFDGELEWIRDAEHCEVCPESSFYDRMSAAQQYEYDRQAAYQERLDMWRNER